MDRTTILFDGDCGFCRWSMDRIMRWDRGSRLRPVPLQSEEADRLLPGMDPIRKMASWHLVTPDGRVLSAGAAAAPLFRRLPAGRPLATIAATFPGPTDALYRLVARSRHRLGRMVGQQACAVDPTLRRNLAPPCS